MILSGCYSSVICESCNSKLSEFSDFQSELIENQINLYNHTEQWMTEQIFVEHIDEEEIKEEHYEAKPDDSNSFSQDLVVVRLPRDETSSCVDNSPPIELEETKSSSKHDWPCVICNTSFSSRQHLRVHSKQHKTEANQNKSKERMMCPLCGLSFSKNGWYHHVSCDCF